MIITAARVDAVVTRQAGNQIAFIITPKAVSKIAANQPLNAGKSVTIRTAIKAAINETGPDIGGGISVGNGIDPGTTMNIEVARAGLKIVVASLASQRVPRSGIQELVVEGSACIGWIKEAVRERAILLN